MAQNVAESFLVSLGFKADTAALDETISRLREITRLVERLRVLGVNVQMDLVESSVLAGEPIAFEEPAGAGF
jgi:hypothetical protein